MLNTDEQRIAEEIYIRLIVQYSTRGELGAQQKQTAASVAITSAKAFTEARKK
jgi:hypothetical protein